MFIRSANQKCRNAIKYITDKSKKEDKSKISEDDTDDNIDKHDDQEFLKIIKNNSVHIYI